MLEQFSLTPESKNVQRDSKKNPFFGFVMANIAMLTFKNPFSSSRTARIRYSRMCIEAALRGSELHEILADCAGIPQEVFKKKILIYNSKVLSDMGVEYKPVVGVENESKTSTMRQMQKASMV